MSLNRLGFHRYILDDSSIWNSQRHMSSPLQNDMRSHTHRHRGCCHHHIVQTHEKHHHHTLSVEAVNKGHAWCFLQLYCHCSVTCSLACPGWGSHKWLRWIGQSWWWCIHQQSKRLSGFQSLLIQEDSARQSPGQESQLTICSLNYPSQPNHQLLRRRRPPCSEHPSCQRIQACTKSHSRLYQFQHLHWWFWL